MGSVIYVTKRLRLIWKRRLKQRRTKKRLTWYAYIAGIEPWLDVRMHGSGAPNWNEDWCRQAVGKVYM